MKLILNTDNQNNNFHYQVQKNLSENNLKGYCYLFCIY